jgi:hypothetical protein
MPRAPELTRLSLTWHGSFVTYPIMRNRTAAQSHAVGFLSVFAVFFAWSWAHGQSESTVEADFQRASLMDRLSNTIPSSTVGFAEPSPGDSDLGEQLLLTPRQRYQAFYLYGGVSEFYTSNATLVGDDFGSDWFTMIQAGLNYTPHLTGNLYGEAFVRQDIFRYARYPELNFNSTNLGAGLIYVIRQLGDLSVYGRYGYTFLTNATASNSIYDEQYFKFGLQKPWQINRAQIIWTGLNATIPIAGSPGFALRDQFVGYLNYQVGLTRSLTANAFYQIGYFPFRENQRADWNQIVSGSLTWQAWKWFSASATVSGAFNSSNESFYNYSVLNVGLGVNAAIQF